jgi:hypothetical protein
MNNFKMMLFNGLILIVLGLISYFNSDVKSGTAMIAPIAGVLLVILAFPTKNGNRTAAHIGVVLTLLIAISLIVPIIRSGSVYAIAMCVISFIAVAYYIKGFIDMKKAKSVGQS